MCQFQPSLLWCVQIMFGMNVCSNTGAELNVWPLNLTGISALVEIKPDVLSESIANVSVMCVVKRIMEFSLFCRGRVTLEVGSNFVRVFSCKQKR